MKRSIGALLLLFLAAAAYPQSVSDSLYKAYGYMLSGTPDQKKNALELFRENYTNDTVVEMCSTLITTFYLNERFREDDEKAFQQNKLVEEMLLILAKNGSVKCFPVFLSVVNNPHQNRYATVRAAWKGLSGLKW